MKEKLEHVWVKRRDSDNTGKILPSNYKIMICYILEISRYTLNFDQQKN